MYTGKSIFTAIVLCLFSFAAFAQTKPEETPPYLQHPTIPAFKVRMLDSSVFNTFDIPKGKTTVFIFFSPDCGHCQMLTDSLVAHMDAFKKEQIYMLGVADLSKIRDFGVTRKLNAFKNITLGKDQDFFFLGYYGAKSFPFIAVYDSKKNLIKGFDGSMQIGDLVNAVK